MAERSKTSPAGPDWKTKWPRGGDLKTWFRAGLRKCEAILDDDRAATAAHSPIGQFAKMGCVKEALRAVDRSLRRLPGRHFSGRVVSIVRMAELGAELCLDADDLASMERFLAIAEATEPFVTHKSSRGFCLNSVREFRAEQGILDPADAVDEGQRIEATFHGAQRRFKRALATHDRETARAAVAEMVEIAFKTKPGGDYRRWWLGAVMRCLVLLGNSRVRNRCLGKFSEENRREVLDAKMLLSLGMKAEARARANRDIEEDLEKLRSSDDPNIHFDAMSIRDSLAFLVEQGQKAEARRWLSRALAEMPTWPVIQTGWTTSSVYHSFAEAMALIDGPAAAERLLRDAETDAGAETRSGFRKGAVGAALDLKADLGRLDEAIEDARKLRSPAERREKLATHLAKARRWTELREVLRTVASPEEAAHIAWWIKFELPGGEAR